MSWSVIFFKSAASSIIGIGFLLLIYIWVLPLLFNEYKTSLFFFIVAILVFSYNVFLCISVAAETNFPRVILYIFAGMIPTVITIIISLFIIINIRGS